MEERIDVFTAGQIAQLCKVARSTVYRWFDTGLLKGYRIPGSRDRRVLRGHLVQFLADNGMSCRDLEEERHRVLFIGTEQAFLDQVQEAFDGDEPLTLARADTDFVAGVRAGIFHPKTLVIDLDALGKDQAGQLAQELRRTERFADCLFLALTDGQALDAADLRRLGFQEALARHPLRDVAERLRRQIA